MPNIIEIQDLAAPALAVYSRLTEPQLRNRLEPEQGIFIAESLKVIELALRAGYRPRSFLMEHKRVAGQARELLASCGAVPVYTAAREVLAQLTGYTLTRGILCALERPVLPTVAQVCEGARRIAVLEGITDATNVGAIFRSAAALGIDAVLVTNSCCDPLCRRSVRVSMGTIFQVPWTRVDNDLHILSVMGFATAALALSPEAISIADVRLQEEDKLALIFGTEGYGLSQATLEQCSYVVQIPMAQGVDSLNVAAASAVAFWQLRR